MSNVYLAELAAGVVAADQSSIIQNFLMFFLAIGGSYIPWVYANVMLSKAIAEGFASGVESVALENVGDLQKWADSDARKGFDFWLGKELYLYYEDVCSTLFQAIAIGSNIVLSVIALSALIDATLGVAYFFAIALSFLVFRVAEAILEREATEAQRARNTLDGTLHFFWDSVLLGNSHHFKDWLSLMKSQSVEYVTKSVKKTHRYQLTTLTATYLAYFPVFLVLGYHLYANIGDAVFLASLSVLLVRNLNVLNEINGLVDLRSYWIDVKTRKRNVDLELSKNPGDVERALLSRFNKDDVSVGTSAGPLDWERFWKLLRDKEKRRVTIRGANGAGKTTVLLLAKKELGDDAIIMPSEAGIVGSVEAMAQSTGQRKRALILNSVQVALETGKVLLLDEWNANLDDVTTAELNKAVEDLSRNNLVVEVLHRNT